MLGSSRVAAQLAASQEGLGSMSELVSESFKTFKPEVHVNEIEKFMSYP
jgi:hypothetical protein